MRVLVVVMGTDRISYDELCAQRDASVLNSRTAASQKCGAVPRRARMQGLQIVVSLNSRLESRQEEGGAGQRSLARSSCLSRRLPPDFTQPTRGRSAGKCRTSYAPTYERGGLRIDSMLRKVEAGECRVQGPTGVPRS